MKQATIDSVLLLYLLVEEYWNSVGVIFRKNVDYLEKISGILCG